LKILIITKIYPRPAYGGYELRCQEQAEEMRKRGHEVSILTCRRDTSQEKKEKDIYRLLHKDKTIVGAGFRRLGVFFIFIKRKNQLRNAWANRRNYTICRKILRRLKPDIGYIWQLNGALIKPVLAVQKERLPIIFNLGDHWLKDLKTETDLESNRLKKKFRLFLLGIKDFRQIDLRYLLTNSLSLRQKYVDAGFKEENITVIPRGIPFSLLLDHADLKNLSKAHNDKIKLVFVGRLVPDKAPDIAIRAVSHIIQQTGIDKIHLDIFGSGDKGYSEVLQNIATALKINNNVHFLGQIEHDELLPRYQTYDCLLFTARWEEPFSTVILEAMARGLPVIATNSGSVTEVITDGINGIIVPKDQPIALSNAIKKVIQDHDFAQKIRHAALDTIRNNFEFERIIDKTEDYLQMAKKNFVPPLIPGCPRDNS